MRCWDNRVGQRSERERPSELSRTRRFSFGAVHFVPGTLPSVTKEGGSLDITVVIVNSTVVVVMLTVSIITSPFGSLRKGVEFVTSWEVDSGATLPLGATSAVFTTTTPASVTISPSFVATESSCA